MFSGWRASRPARRGGFPRRRDRRARNEAGRPGTHAQRPGPTGSPGCSTSPRRSTAIGRGACGCTRVDQLALRQGLELLRRSPPARRRRVALGAQASGRSGRRPAGCRSRSSLLDPAEQVVAAAAAGSAGPGRAWRLSKPSTRSARPHRPASIESSAVTAAPSGPVDAARDHFELAEREDVIIESLPQPGGRDPDKPRRPAAGRIDVRLVLGVLRDRARSLGDATRSARAKVGSSEISTREPSGKPKPGVSGKSIGRAGTSRISSIGTERPRSTWTHAVASGCG